MNSRVTQHPRLSLISELGNSTPITSELLDLGI
jgi:hypothetical protein